MGSVTVRKPLAKAISKTKQFVVDTAVNGFEGLKMMKKLPYDLVLCDFLMPVMDGIDCMAQLRHWERNHRPDLRQLVVGMSANAGLDTDARNEFSGTAFAEFGFDYFKAKPIGLAEVQKLCSSDIVRECSRHIEQ